MLRPKERSSFTFERRTATHLTEAKQVILQLSFYAAMLQRIVEKYECSPDGRLPASLTVSMFMLKDFPFIFVICLAVTTLLLSATTVGAGDPVDIHDSHQNLCRTVNQKLYYNL